MPATVPEHAYSGPTAFEPTTARTWDDRLALRFPRVNRGMMRAVARLVEAMRPGSRIRVALVRRTAERSYGAWNRGDAEVLCVLYHPECVWDDTHWLTMVGSTVYHGHEGLREAARTWWESWSEFYSTGSELRDLGDRFVITGHFYARGRESGVPVTMTYVQISTQRDGLIDYVANYLDPDEAAAALARPSRMLRG